ncbi:sulfate transporter [Byssothecium circinans]|uniref:Sulfate transporter n=1 Tax=Byssothecium circinans TaxID=147558 RepID=A0A6A5TX91_9PLEO|nr:sulfate transporter [Byssothecium circinans]
MFSVKNPLPHLRDVHRHNVHALQSSLLAELSGSLGDLGTLLPLMTALVITESISLPATLLFTGAANVLTGLAFGIPLPVQPMKAIAAVAISREFTLEENAAAGLVVASLVGLFSVTGLLKRANKVTPIPIVKGIQVGAGLSLCLSAGSKMLMPLSWTGPWWGDNLLWAIAAVFLLLFTFAYPRLPYALIVFSVGIVLSLLSRKNDAGHFSTAIPIVHPSGNDFWKATTTASLGQLPLTLLNSVIAASALAADYFPSPHYPAYPTVTELGVSVAAINLVGCWFGAMPACHGSGGLAAQYRFGARSGSSIVFLGLVKFFFGIVALITSGPIVSVLSGIPKSLLGVLVLAAGIELAKVGESVNTDARDLRIYNADGKWDRKTVKHIENTEKNERWTVMLVTIATLLAFRNDAVGFIAGLAWHWGLKAAAKVNDWRERREGRMLLRRASQHYGERTGLLFHEESDRVA